MIFRQVKVGQFQNFSYLVGDESTGSCAIVDPHGEVDRLLKLARDEGLTVDFVINTHTHWDHVAGNDEVVRKTGAKIVMHKKGRGRRDVEVDDGEIVRVGNLQIKVIHAPGHSPEEICLKVENKLLTGDTLFVGECGRTDLPGGSPEEMYDSLFNKIMKLDDRLEIYPGHDYGPRPFSTLGYEKRHNYTLQPRTKEEFVRFMGEP